MTLDRPQETRTRIEFWPDYGGALLWAAGERIALNALPLSSDLIYAASRWLAEYEDSKLPWEPTRDDTWLAEGRGMYVALGDALWEHGIELVAGEDHWRPSG